MTSWGCRRNSCRFKNLRSEIRRPNQRFRRMWTLLRVINPRSGNDKHPMKRRRWPILNEHAVGWQIMWLRPGTGALRMDESRISVVPSGRIHFGGGRPTQRDTRASRPCSSGLIRVNPGMEIMTLTFATPDISSFALAGEKFRAWIKSCKQKPLKECLKKFTTHKTIVKSGENVFRAEAFLVGTAVAKASPSAITTGNGWILFTRGCGWKPDCARSA